MDEQDKKLADEVLAETMKIKELTLSISEIVPMGEFRNSKPMMSITWEGEINFEKAQTELKDRFSAWLPSIINRAEHKIAKEENANTCKTHSMPFTKFGESTKGKWSMHKNEQGEACFGTGYLPKK